jgi:putative two-component system response regulator
MSRIMARRPDARILIVDDEQSNTRLLVRLLGRSGYTSIRTLTDASGALHEYREFEPDLVLLDLRMPQLDGFTLLRLVKQVVRPDGWVPVLVISGDTSMESRHRARVLGASDYVLKPYETDDLLLRIDTLLEMRRQVQDRAREMNRLRAELQATAADQTATELHALAGLSAACAFRDSASEGHTTRVGELAAEIARELALPAELVDMLRQCAPLHDVGKIAIPDDILLKTGALTVAEMAIAERHTTTRLGPDHAHPRQGRVRRRARRHRHRTVRRRAEGSVAPEVWELCRS